MYDEEMVPAQRFIDGPSLDDCKSRLYKDFGTNYQIVNIAKRMKPGFLGFGQKEFIRVFYAIPSDGLNGKVLSKPSSAEPSRDQPQLTKEQALQLIRQITDSPQKLGGDFLKSRDELVEKSQLGQLMESMKELKRQMEDVFDTVHKNASAGGQQMESVTRIQRILEENEFTPSYIDDITRRLNKEFSVSDLEDFDKVQAKVFDWIGDDIHVAKPATVRPPHVVVIIGPTGVGKTTTLAKMVANVLLAEHGEDEKKPVVRMISTDYMRVGAMEMLEKYGYIMKIPVDKAENVADIKKLYSMYRSKCDYIFIDTSGISPRDYQNMATMRELLDVPSMHADVYLAVAAGTKARDLEEIMRNYEQFNFSSVIITKYDETSSFGNVLSVLSQKNKEISWITTGQQVPRFIERANPYRFLMALEGFHKDEAKLRKKFKYEPKAED